MDEVYLLKIYLKSGNIVQFEAIKLRAAENPFAGTLAHISWERVGDVQPVYIDSESVEAVMIERTGQSIPKAADNTGTGPYR